MPPPIIIGFIMPIPPIPPIPYRSSVGRYGEKTTKGGEKLTKGGEKLTEMHTDHHHGIHHPSHPSLTNTYQLGPVLLNVPTIIIGFIIPYMPFSFPI